MKPSELDADNIDPLALEAYAEMEQAEPTFAEKHKKLEQAKDEEQPDEDQPSKAKAKPQEKAVEEKVEDEEKEEVKEPPEEEVEKEEPEETPEEKPKEEEKPEEVKEEDLIRDIAVDEGLTTEEAKEVFNARKNLLEKYKNDPKEMVKAIQSTQSAYDKLKTENEKLKSQPDVENIEQMIVSQEQRIGAYVESKRDELIDAYKNKYPRKTQNMDDEQIVEEITNAIRSEYRSWADRKKGEIKDSASKKRNDVLSEIDAKDKEFIPEVKKILQDTPDVSILSKSFDIQDIVKFVRGERYTPEAIEKIKQEAYERGKQEAKIVGTKIVKGPGAKPIQKVTPSASLNEAQKERASQMFPDKSLDEAVKEYKDLYKEELKNDPAFIG